MSGNEDKKTAIKPDQEKLQQIFKSIYDSIDEKFYDDLVDSSVNRSAQAVIAALLTFAASLLAHGNNFDHKSSCLSAHMYQDYFHSMVHTVCADNTNQIEEAQEEATHETKH